MHRIRVTPFALVLLLAACTAAPIPQPVIPPPADEPVGSPEIHGALHWARNSAEHKTIYLQTYNQAGDRLEQLVDGLSPFTWAIAVDADETLIDNSQFEVEQLRAGTSFSYDAFYAWARRGEAKAMPGARDFLERVRGLGGKIVVVTNRDQVICPATEANLRYLRLPVDLVMCRTPEGGSDKSPRWEAVQQGRASKFLPPLRIVMWLGDAIGDFPTGSQAWRNAPPEQFDRFGRDWFMFPNPVYGGWEDNPPE